MGYNHFINFFGTTCCYGGRKIRGLSDHFQDEELMEAASVVPIEFKEVTECMEYSQDNTMDDSSTLDISQNEFESATVDMVLMRVLKNAGVLLMHAFNERSAIYS